MPKNYSNKSYEGWSGEIKNQLCNNIPQKEQAEVLLQNFWDDHAKGYTQADVFAHLLQTAKQDTDNGVREAALRLMPNLAKTFPDAYLGKPEDIEALVRETYNRSTKPYEMISEADQKTLTTMCNAVNKLVSTRQEFGSKPLYHDLRLIQSSTYSKGFMGEVLSLKLAVVLAMPSEEKVGMDDPILDRWLGDGGIKTMADLEAEDKERKSLESKPTESKPSETEKGPDCTRPGIRERLRNHLSPKS